MAVVRACMTGWPFNASLAAGISSGLHRSAGRAVRALIPHADAVPQRLRCLLHRAVDYIGDSGNGEWQIGWPSLHSAHR